MTTNNNTISIPITKQTPEIKVIRNANNSTVNLFDYFDDPSTNGTIAQFELEERSLAGGIIRVLLFDQENGTGSPLTSANFLQYVDAGLYDNSFIHRSVPFFVIQGGGYTLETPNNTLGIIETFPPIQNEFSPEKSNIRGTIAMAKGSDPNSATSQWFFNTSDNSNDLDDPNNSGGFTIFGKVLDDADLAVVDAIANLPIFDVSASIPGSEDIFKTVPLFNESDAVSFSTISQYNLPELQFTILDNSNPELVTVNLNENNELILDYQENQSGTAEINLEVTNLLGETIEEVFTVEVQAPLSDIGADFNLDDNQDIIWRNQNDNSLPISYFDGLGNKIGEDFLINGANNNIISLHSNWNTVKGDFIGSTQSDLFLQNKVNGTLRIWEISENEVIDKHFLINRNNGNQIQVNSNWDIVTGNFLGTFQDDILLKNKVNGKLRIWEIDEAEVVTFNEVLRNGEEFQLKSNNWEIFSGNFVGSDQDDILLRNIVSNSLIIWEMDGNEIINIFPILNNGNEVKLNQNWEITIEDFIGTEQDDLLLRNKINGSLRLWEMEDNQIVSNNTITDTTSLDSSLVI